MTYTSKSSAPAARFLKEARVSYRSTRIKLPEEQVCDSDAAARIFRKVIVDNGQEQLHILGLSPSNRILGWSQLGLGTANTCNIDLAAIIRWVCLTNCTNIILGHNHPSETVNASEQDRKCFQSVKKALETHEIARVLDFIILGTKGQYTSLA